MVAPDYNLLNSTEPPYSYCILYHNLNIKKIPLWLAEGGKLGEVYAGGAMYSPLSLFIHTPPSSTKNLSFPGFVKEFFRGMF